MAAVKKIIADVLYQSDYFKVVGQKTNCSCRELTVFTRASNVLNGSTTALQVVCTEIGDVNIFNVLLYGNEKKKGR